jgi:uncharacterized membrane protein
VFKTSAELLDLPVTRGRLHALAAAGLLDQAELARALSESEHRPTRASWARYLVWHAWIVGVVLLVAGTIFFVAANWSVLPGSARMAIVGVPMIAATLIGGYLGDSLVGRVASLLGGLLFGPLLAVYGQVYQTGADPWQLFAGWTVVLIAYGALTRFVGTWVLALVCLHVAGFAWLEQELGVPDPYGGRGPEQAIGPLFVAGLALVDALVVALAEWFTKGRQREILRHTAGFAGLALVLPIGLMTVLEELPWGGEVGLGVLVVGLFAIWTIYRWRRPALGMLAGFACVVTILVSAACTRFLFEVVEVEDWFWATATLGVVVCGQVWGFTHWLLSWRREHALALANTEVHDDAA